MSKKDLKAYLKEIRMSSSSEEVSSVLDRMDNEHSSGNLLISENNWPELTSEIASWKIKNESSSK